MPGWVEEDPFTSRQDDPLGIDSNDRLERVSPTQLDDEVQRRIPVVAGEVLGAIAGVREEHHEVDVRLEHGLAFVEVRMRFRSRAQHAAEVRYRLAVPEGVSLASLRVCNRHGCRDGLVDESTGMLGPYDDAIRARARSADRPPVAHVTTIEDDRGHALWLRAAPVPPQPPEQAGVRDEAHLDVTLRYVVSAPVQGAAVRFTLPARGRDARAAPAGVRVRSDELSDGAVDGQDAAEHAVERAAWQPIELTARIDPSRPDAEAEAWVVPCGAGHCARIRVVARPRPIRARDIIVLIDASPSTMGSARGRIGPTVAALLSSLPSRSRLRIAAFAARAEAIVQTSTAPTEVSLVQVTRALESELGSATRFEAAWDLVEPWVRQMREPLILIVGDGGLTAGAASTRALEAASRSGARVAVLNVADRRSTSSLVAALEAIDARLIDAGREADRAARGHGMEPLTERLAALLAPVIEPHVRARVGRRIVDLGALRAGEELVWEGQIEGRRVSVVRPDRTRGEEPPPTLALAIRDRLERSAGQGHTPLRLAALAPDSLAGDPDVCTVQGSRRSTSAPVGPSVRLAPAATRRCNRSPFPTRSPPESPTEANAPEHLRPHEGPTSLPERSLLTMLRQRIIPAARGCFRNARHGRPSYQRRAVFEFRLADREVVAADVHGSLATPLRECLVRAMDSLDIPPFDGSVRVRYPVYTAARLPPPTLSLDPAVADAVDAIAPDSP